MKKLTTEEYYRLIEAYFRKHYHLFTRSMTSDDLKSIIGTVMVDTELVLAGVLCIEDFEK